MPRPIDPSYLRSVRDQVLAGLLDPQNPDGLPDGLAEMFDRELFAPEMTIRERQRLLAFFAVPALLKKEVGTDLWAQVLGDDWPPASVRETLLENSKRFMSTEPGRYQLYHERFRAYVLQRISEKELFRINRTIIALCEKALDDRAGDEWEFYALEFCAHHLFLEAMASGDGTRLQTLAYDKGFWDRQIKTSKGFEWSKNLLWYSLRWAFKHAPNESIECALQHVDLHYIEQNDALRIVELIAQNDLETALARIESFGGNDVEGLQRKFTLYMLCLLELTLLGSKDKPHRRQACEQLLRHFDEQMPPALNWGEFFSSYLMFQMANQWAEMELDYNVVYKRTGHWKGRWISQKGPYSDRQLEVLAVTTNGLEYLRSALAAILAKQGRAEEALDMARELKNASEKCKALAAISSELAKGGNAPLAATLTEESLNSARSMDQASDKCAALTTISSELYEQGLADVSWPVLQEAMEAANAISGNEDKCRKTIEICRTLIKQGRSNEAAEAIQEAWNLVKEKINYEEEKSNLLGQISTLLHMTGKTENAKTALDEAREEAKKSVVYESKALIELSSELFEQNQEEAEKLVEYAHEATVRKHTNNYRRDLAWFHISGELAKQGNAVRALKTIFNIKGQRKKQEAQFRASIIFFEQDNVEIAVSVLQDATKINSGITHEHSQITAKENIFKKLIHKEDLSTCLNLARSVKRDYVKEKLLQDIAFEWAKSGNIEQAIDFIKEATKSNRNEYAYSSGLNRLSVQLTKQGQYDRAIEVAQHIPDDDFFKPVNRALLEIAAEFAVQNNLDLDGAVSLIKDRFKDDRPQDEKSLKNKIRYNACDQLARSGRIADALELIETLDDGSEKMRLLEDLARNAEYSDRLAEIGPKILQAMETAGEDRRYWGERYIQELSDKLTKIAEKEMAFQTAVEEITGRGNLDQALSALQKVFAQDNPEEDRGDDLKKQLSARLAELGNLDAAAKVAREITDEWHKTEALTELSISMAKQQHWPTAEQMGREIQDKSQRFSCWEALGRSARESLGALAALHHCKQLQNAEARTYYIKGWAKTVEPVEADTDFAQTAIPYLVSDFPSLEHLLQMYGLNQIFFQNPPQEKIQRLDSTLNLQWALDAKKPPKS